MLFDKFAQDKFQPTFMRKPQGKVKPLGKVNVPKLFEVIGYNPTVIHLSSW